MSLKRICVRKEKLKCPKIPHCPKIPVVTLVTARLPKDQRNQAIGVLMAGSMVNDIAHHFGCSRQTIHYLMNRYNKTG